LAELAFIESRLAFIESRSDMSESGHRQRANELLASVGNKLPGTPAVIAAAHAHAVLALADEVAALRAALESGKETAS
jgi:hypothetical protein